jgi:hypothetical protein
MSQTETSYKVIQTKNLESLVTKGKKPRNYFQSGRKQSYFMLYLYDKLSLLYVPDLSGTTFGPLEVKYI